jgi:hypothetical protein
MDGATAEGDGSIKIKVQTMYSLDLKDIATPEDLLKVFQAMGTIFSIVEGSEVWNEMHDAGMGHLLTIQV